MTDWVIAPNPSFHGRPRILHATCHDETPFLTVVHDCGFELHFHEGQLVALPGLEDGGEILSRCHGCQELFVMPIEMLTMAFAQMREEGWIE